MIPSSQNHIEMSKTLNGSPDFLEEREFDSLGAEYANVVLRIQDASQASIITLVRVP
jgi:hypothetical protein